VNLRWTRRALADVRRHHAWIAASDPIAADRVRDRIREAAAFLEDFPYGAPPLAGRDAHQFIEGQYGYVLVYRVKPRSGEVHILRVFHPRQNRP
jgi:plasmid stabilization system protein ParE